MHDCNTSQQPNEQEVITEKYAHCRSKLVCKPQENDVLLGRGGRTRDHEGNIYFRDIVQASKERYKNERLRFDRKYIAIEIYRAVRKRNPPGRFLICPKNNEKWFEVTRKKAVSKTCQALREKEIISELTEAPCAYPFGWLNENLNNAADSNRLVGGGDNSLHDQQALNLLPPMTVPMPDQRQSFAFYTTGNEGDVSSRKLETRDSLSPRPCVADDCSFAMDTHYSRKKIKLSEGNVQDAAIPLEIDSNASTNKAPQPSILLPPVIVSNSTQNQDAPFNSIAVERKISSQRLQKENARNLMPFKEKNRPCKLHRDSSTKINRSDGNGQVRVIPDKIESWASENKEACSGALEKHKHSLPNVESAQENTENQVIVPISHIGQSFSARRCELESKKIFELIASLEDKGEQASLFLPIVIGKLCRRIADLEKNDR